MSTHTREVEVIRPATAADAPAIIRIYNYYVANSVITFEVEPVSIDDMVGRIGNVQSSNLPWLVAEEAGEVLGYAYAGKWNTRSAYERTVESTIYLAYTATGRGLGIHLYSALFDVLRAQGIHVVIGVIALPNVASVALHERFGFKSVGRFFEVGHKFNRWVDVGYWQLTW